MCRGRGLGFTMKRRARYSVLSIFYVGYRGVYREVLEMLCI